MSGTHRADCCVNSDIHTHAHTHTHIYIYIYMLHMLKEFLTRWTRVCRATLSLSGACWRRAEWKRRTLNSWRRRRSQPPKRRNSFRYFAGWWVIVSNALIFDLSSSFIRTDFRVQNCSNILTLNNSLSVISIYHSKILTPSVRVMWWFLEARTSCNLAFHRFWIIYVIHITTRSLRNALHRQIRF
jgi:hypothetical protein